MLLNHLKPRVQEFSQYFPAFRVEDKNGIGPFYQWGFFGRYLQEYLEQCRDTNSGEFPPTPFGEEGYDGVEFVKGKHICGVDSLEKLLDWFAPALEMLRLKGYRVAMYKVAKTNLTIAKHQVWFEPKDGIFIKFLDSKRRRNLKRVDL
jgi:hypothetical protein